MDDEEQATPQQTLAGLRRAMARADWGRALEFLSPRAQRALAGAACAGAAWAEHHDERSRRALHALLETHGLVGGLTAPRAAADLVRLLEDLMAWSAACLPPDGQLDLARDLQATTYSDFRQVGERAYAIATLRGRRSEVRFRRTAGRWYLLASGE